MLRIMTAALALLIAQAAAATPTLILGPQPAPGSVQPGLAVDYAYPASVKWLGEATRALDQGAKRGLPLKGLDYPDEGVGAEALTSGRAELVAARIEGWIKFDQAGVWRLEFHSNDGLEVSLSGIRVYVHDGRHACDTQGWVEVNVPAPGWYELKATWFQRFQSSCLMLKVQEPGGATRWTDVNDYAHRP